MITLYVTTDTPIEDQGTIVVFDATDETGATVRVGIDYRAAQDIVDIVDDQGELAIAVEPYQILGMVPA